MFEKLCQKKKSQGMQEISSLNFLYSIGVWKVCHDKEVSGFRFQLEMVFTQIILKQIHIKIKWLAVQNEEWVKYDLE